MERCDTCQYVEGLFDSHSMGKCEFKTFLPVFLSASFDQKIQQTIKIQEIPRKSKMLVAPWIFFFFENS